MGSSGKTQPSTVEDEPASQAFLGGLDWTPQDALDVTVVVPVQSSEADVRQVVDALGTELDREGRSWECIFVFDGVAGRA